MAHRRPLSAAVAAAAVLALAACADPDVAAHQPDTLSLVVDDADELAQAGEDATEYCGQQGLGADLVETTQLDDGVVARYVCE